MELAICRHCDCFYKIRGGNVSIPGYCSDKHAREKAEKLGWNPKKLRPSVLDILESKKAVGTILAACRCRKCGKKYDPLKSRADYTGYCSQRCLKEKAREFGWKPSSTDSYYTVLNRNHEIGDIPFEDRPMANPDTVPPPPQPKQQDSPPLHPFNVKEFRPDEQFFHMMVSPTVPFLDGDFYRYRQSIVTNRDPAFLADLAFSMYEHGPMNPLIAFCDDATRGPFKIWSGFQRFDAARMIVAGFEYKGGVYRKEHFVLPIRVHVGVDPEVAYPELVVNV